MKILKYLLGAAVVVALSAACSSKTETAKADEAPLPRQQKTPRPRLLQPMA